MWLRLLGCRDASMRPIAHRIIEAALTEQLQKDHLHQLYGLSCCKIEGVLQDEARCMYCTQQIIENISAKSFVNCVQAMLCVTNRRSYMTVVHQVGRSLHFRFIEVWLPVQSKHVAKDNKPPPRSRRTAMALSHSWWRTRRRHRIHGKTNIR